MFFELVLVSSFKKDTTTSWKKRQKSLQWQAKTRANYWSTFSLQLWWLWKDIHRCWCIEETFSHPWREAVCLSLRWMWKGSDFNTYRCTPIHQHLLYICHCIAKLWNDNLHYYMLEKQIKLHFFYQSLIQWVAYSFNATLCWALAS